jgi:putative alpha-1,2-mannosidase
MYNYAGQPWKIRQRNREVQFRRRIWNNSFFTHDELLSGGIIQFKMDDKSNKALCTSRESYPPSVTLLKR